jgi:hypothetical protein
VLGALCVIAVTACATSDGTTARSTTTAIAPQRSTAALDAAGCPVSDEAFCATAIEAANALAAGDAGQLVGLSRSDTVICAKVAREYFPGCQADDVLKGYGLSDADFIVELVNVDAYGEAVAALTSSVDPSFTDEIGDGGARVIGVGTCGPDLPSRRTYHLAWTAGLDDPDGTARRVLGSFEFSFDEGQWRIALLYLDTLERWHAEQTDPLEEAFCAAGQSPWS